jgi:hypothetical protein
MEPQRWTPTQDSLLSAVFWSCVSATGYRSDPGGVKLYTASHYYHAVLYYCWNISSDWFLNIVAWKSGVEVIYRFDHGVGNIDLFMLPASIRSHRNFTSVGPVDFKNSSARKLFCLLVLTQSSDIKLPLTKAIIYFTQHEMFLINTLVPFLLQTVLCLVCDQYMITQVVMFVLGQHRTFSESTTSLLLLLDALFRTLITFFHGCYYHLRTGVFVITFLIYFTIKISFGTSLALSVLLLYFY